MRDPPYRPRVWGSAYRTALTQITRHVQRARDVSEDVPTREIIAAWGIARWARCGECERCEDAANGGRSRWLRLKDGNPVGCVNPVLSMDVETPVPFSIDGWPLVRRRCVPMFAAAS